MGLAVSSDHTLAVEGALARLFISESMWALLSGLLTVAVLEAPISPKLTDAARWPTAAGPRPAGRLSQSKIIDPGATGRKRPVLVPAIWTGPLQGVAAKPSAIRTRRYYSRELRDGNGHQSDDRKKVLLNSLAAGPAHGVWHVETHPTDDH